MTHLLFKKRSVLEHEKYHAIENCAPVIRPKIDHCLALSVLYWSVVLSIKYVCWYLSSSGKMNEKIPGEKRRTPLCCRVLLYLRMTCVALRDSPPDVKTSPHIHLPRKRERILPKKRRKSKMEYIFIIIFGLYLAWRWHDGISRQIDKMKFRWH